MTSSRVRLKHSDDESHSFPSQLFDSAKELEWDSPTKRQRTIVAPRKARRRNVPFQPAAEGREGALDLPDNSVGVSDLSQPSALPSASSEALLDSYAEAVEAQVAGFYHLEGNLFVVQGWDCEKGQTTVCMCIWLLRHSYSGISENSIVILASPGVPSACTTKRAFRSMHLSIGNFTRGQLYSPSVLQEV
jgi:hypothetical protein